MILHLPEYDKLRGKYAELFIFGMSGNLFLLLLSNQSSAENSPSGTFASLKSGWSSPRA